MFTVSLWEVVAGSYHLHPWWFVKASLTTISSIHINMLDEVPKSLNITGYQHVNQSCIHMEIKNKTKHD